MPPSGQQRSEDCRVLRTRGDVSVTRSDSGKPGGAKPGGQTPDGARPGGQTPDSARPGGQAPDGARPGGQTPDGAPPGAQDREPRDATRPGGSQHASARRSERARGLDGLRGVAVLMVLAFHERISGLPGGFLGVDVFFVISGYLITDLLASPWDQGGRLDLRAFWIRRARRLLPSLAVVLITVTAALAVLEPDQLPDLRPGLLAAVTYTSNWWQALHHQSYFAVFGPPPPLQHLWSLAIEEQFYLLWPFILTVVLFASTRRRTRAVVVWLGATAS